MLRLPDSTFIESFDVDLDFVESKASESDYWETVDIFLNSIKHKPLKFLTHRQIAWLEEIEAACEDA